MHLQIIEPYLGGHHSNYLEALIPALDRCLDAGLLSRVTITITPEHYQHLQTAVLESGALETGVTFDATFPSISPAPTLRDRVNLFRALNRAVLVSKPDHLIVPSADYDVMIQALLNQFVSFGQHTKIKATGIIHYGMPLSLSASLKELLKQRIYQVAWRFSHWNTLMMVNPLMYESLKDKGSYKKSLQVLPDPVPEAIEISVSDARQYFALPDDVVLFGAVGMMDERKAIPELLEAFSSLHAHNKKAKLALLGQLASAYDSLIKAQYQHLVDAGDLIVVNRYLSQHEIQLAYAAMDVLLILQYRRANLSANLLKAMMYDKPIIADAFGYTGMMLSRFKLGYKCSVGEPQSIKAAMQSSAQATAEYVPSVQTKRLKAFHAPENFANILLRDVLGEKVSLPVKTWEWVCEQV